MGGSDEWHQNVRPGDGVDVVYVAHVVVCLPQRQDWFLLSVATTI